MMEVKDKQNICDSSLFQMRPQEISGDAEMHNQRNSMTEEIWKDRKYKGN